MRATRMTRIDVAQYSSRPIYHVRRRGSIAEGLETTKATTKRILEIVEDGD